MAATRLYSPLQTGRVAGASLTPCNVANTQKTIAISISNAEKKFDVNSV